MSFGFALFLVTFNLYYTIYSFTMFLTFSTSGPIESEDAKDTASNRFYYLNIYIIYKMNDYLNAMALLYLFYCLTSYHQRRS
jgi:hypothetical protein